MRTGTIDRILAICSTSAKKSLTAEIAEIAERNIQGILCELRVFRG